LSYIGNDAVRNVVCNLPVIKTYSVKLKLKAPLHGTCIGILIHLQLIALIYDTFLKSRLRETSANNDCPLPGPTDNLLFTMGIVNYSVFLISLQNIRMRSSDRRRDFAPRRRSRSWSPRRRRPSFRDRRRSPSPLRRRRSRSPRRSSRSVFHTYL
jgi:hypothetical protein